MMACSHVSHILLLHNDARLLVKTGCSGIKQKNSMEADIKQSLVHGRSYHCVERAAALSGKGRNNVQPCTGSTHPGAPLSEAAEEGTIGKTVLLCLVP